MLIHLHQPSAVQLLDETRTRARILGEEATQQYPDQPWNAVERHLAGEWLMPGRARRLAGRNPRVRDPLLRRLPGVRPRGLTARRPEAAPPRRAELAPLARPPVPVERSLLR